jgi:pyrroloquinoline quinone biosynthesis protein A
MEAGARRPPFDERTVFHGRRSSDRRGPFMKWETPQACDTRFGFEITMYISTR